MFVGIKKEEEEEEEERGGGGGKCGTARGFDKRPCGHFNAQ